MSDETLQIYKYERELPSHYDTDEEMSVLTDKHTQNHMLYGAEQPNCLIRINKSLLVD